MSGRDDRARSVAPQEVPAVAASPIRVVVVDDHPVFRLGMSALLDSLEGIEVVGQAEELGAALRVVDAARPGVVVMDLDLGATSGIDATSEVTARHPGIGVLVVTMAADDDSVFAAMRAGARGYLLKNASPHQVERAVRSVANGEVLFGPDVAQRAMGYLQGARRRGPVTFPELTDREREVLDLVAGGHDNLVIARRLSLSPKTVRNHLSNVLTKLQVADRSQAIVRAREAGLGGAQPPSA